MGTGGRRDYGEYDRLVAARIYYTAKKEKDKGKKSFFTQKKKTLRIAGGQQIKTNLIGQTKPPSRQKSITGKTSVHSGWATSGMNRLREAGSSADLEKDLLSLCSDQRGKTGFLAVGLVFVDHADLDGLVERGAFLAVKLGDGSLVIGSGGRAEGLFERGERVSVGFVFDAGFFAVALRLHSGLADIRFGHGCYLSVFDMFSEQMRIQNNF